MKLQLDVWAPARAVEAYEAILEGRATAEALKEQLTEADYAAMYALLVLRLVAFHEPVTREEAMMAVATLQEHVERYMARADLN